MISDKCLMQFGKSFHLTKDEDGDFYATIWERNNDGAIIKSMSIEICCIPGNGGGDSMIYEALENLKNAIEKYGLEIQPKDQK